MPVVIPFTFVGGPGNKAKASEVNANFAALKSKFDANIGNSDFTSDPSERLDGNKISQIGGMRVPTVSIEDEAITESKLQGDPNPGSDANRAVSGDHIKLLSTASLDRILGAGGIKKAMIGADQVTLTQLDVTVDIVAFSFSVSGPGVQQVGVADEDVPPAGTFPKADWELTGIYIKNFAATGSGAKWAVPRAIDTGTNWTGGVRGCNESSSSSTFSGSLVYVFTKRV